RCKEPAAAGLLTLCLHDALPISEEMHVHVTGPAELGVLEMVVLEIRDRVRHVGFPRPERLFPQRFPAAQDAARAADVVGNRGEEDRKSTRLNSSHVKTSYAVFCL